MEIYIILVVIVLCAGWIIVNLLRKQEKLEQIVLDYENHFEGLYTVINDSNEQLQQLDNNGLFKSDDEIGYFFESIQQIQNDMNNFVLNKQN